MSERKRWEFYATKEQLKIRSIIELHAKQFNMPPSIAEIELIKSGKVKEGWDL